MFLKLSKKDKDGSYRECILNASSIQYIERGKQGDTVILLTGKNYVLMVKESFEDIGRNLAIFNRENLQ